MKTLNERIEELEEKIKELQSALRATKKHTETKKIPPYTKVKPNNRTLIRGAGVQSGMGALLGGALIWNEVDLAIPAYGIKASNPTIGYNKHFHSRYAGGALDINYLELVEYEINWVTNDEYNKHCQSVWNGEPTIKKSDVAGYESVDKIGNLQIEFDPEEGKWITMSKHIHKQNKLADGGYLTNETKFCLDGTEEDPTPQQVGSLYMIWNEEDQKWGVSAVWLPHS